ncbi:hypothetical protein [Modestobacter sp. NPDC049651]|uniref:hypothetical protein n=1 Tax=unclassified Modestobacter TaxID=2643866 RepID=UPI0033D4FC84
MRRRPAHRLWVLLVAALALTLGTGISPASAADDGPVTTWWALGGGAAGPMGDADDDEYCGLVGGGCYRDFQNGTGYWSPATGAHGVRFALWEEYYAQGEEGGRLGYPVADEGCGKRDGGCSQEFQGGTTLWSPSAGALSVFGALREHYRALGWENGPLGYPTGSEQCDEQLTTCSQWFQRGVGYWSSSTGAHSVRGALFGEYYALNTMNGVMGLPVTDEACGKRNGGCSQEFQGGTLLWSPTSGAHEVRGALRGQYRSLGWENGRLGYPIADEACGKRNGGCSQEFQGGTLLWSPTAGAHSVLGALRNTYRLTGWENGVLGYPISDEACGKRDGGCSQEFQGGTLLWSPATGAAYVTGSFRDQYRSQGWENGRLGYPVNSPRVDPPRGWVQTFQGGTLRG